MFAKRINDKSKEPAWWGTIKESKLKFCPVCGQAYLTSEEDYVIHETDIEKVACLMRS
jgi:hypothetical protein